MRKVGDESYAGEVALEGLLPGREYLARVSATNSYGESQPGEGFQVREMPFFGFGSFIVQSVSVLDVE